VTVPLRLVNLAGSANGNADQHLIVLILILSYLAGLLTMPACERLLSFFRPMLHWRDRFIVEDVTKCNLL
jgi:hypothetical protein